MKYFSVLVFIIGIVACEKPIDLNINTNLNDIIVEGHIENDVQPYVILTKSFSIYRNINLNNIAQYFVHGASVWVYSNNDTIQLIEYTPDIIVTLSDDVKQSIATQLGISVEVLTLASFSLYSVAPDETFYGELGKTYQLYIEAEGKQLRATTTIPNRTKGFDSLWLETHPNANFPDYFQLYGILNDSNSTDFYRYFTKVDSEPWLISDGSVFDDAFFNGKKFEIFIPKGRNFGSSSDDFDETTGYWNYQDSVLTVKLSIIDRPHYDFWRTLESNRNSQGNPFGSFVVVKSNINGGLGIWGGYASYIQNYSVY